MTALIETRGLSRSFGGLRAVADVDFVMQTGEVRAVIGPNGAGKTTFVSLIAGRLPPSSGKIFFKGQDITPRFIQPNGRTDQFAQNSKLFVRARGPGRSAVICQDLLTIHQNGDA